ncbi:MAG: phosphotransferase [Planctomycetaceae bacterium]|nr:phosphotransferase [Planctomycetaceae bacterium]
MFVTQHNIVHFLLTRGHVSAASVIHRTCRVEDCSSRNRCFKVAFSDSSGIFVKQARQTDSITKKCLEIEAECLRLFARSSHGSTIASFVPDLVEYDEGRSILCTTLISNSMSMRAMQLENPEYRLPLAKAVGTVLAAFHVLPIEETTEQLPDAAHHRVPTLLHGRSLISSPADDPAGVYARIQEYPEYVKLVRESTAYWHADGLTHGDIRWDNILVVESQTVPQVSIVDWELAGIGDTAWDVAGVIQSYLIDWSANRLNTEELQILVREFLTSYLDVRGLPAEETTAYLRRAIIYSGCRLIQSTFEQHQFGTPLDSAGLGLLQLSWNILRDPVAVENDLLLIKHLLVSRQGSNTLSSPERKR